MLPMTRLPVVGMDGPRLTIHPATRYWDVAGAASEPRSPRPRPLRPRPPSPRPPWSIEPRFMPPMAGRIDGMLTQVGTMADREGPAMGGMNRG
ncbi:MAG: hypothetical protein EBV53_03145, partial [Proteobacteria bacterium]|nr:hypothetical protein [Pseudomonadota bacterium]